MTTAITKTWLRRRHRDQGSKLSFRKWCKSEGRAQANTYSRSEEGRDMYPDGINYAVGLLTGLEESEACELKRMELEEVQRARKERSRVRAYASSKRKRERALNKSKKGKKKKEIEE